MNGDVKTLELNKFYTWDEFKKLSTDFQKEWMKHIIQKYGVSVQTISVDVFGIGASSLTDHLIRKGIDSSEYNPTPHAGGPYANRRARRLQLIEDVKKAREPEKITIDVPKVDVDILNAAAKTAFKGEVNKKLLEAATNEINKKLIEDSTIAADEVVNDLKGALGWTEAPDIPLPAVEAKVVDLRQPIETPPAMAYAEIGMDGFDMELIELLRNRFKGKKIHVILKVADVEGCPGEVV